MRDKVIDFLLKRILKPSRVLDIILDESHKDYPLFNTPSCFGYIRHTPLDQENPNSKIFAKPLFPHFKSYPIKNEIVYLIEGPDNIFLTGGNVGTYYIPLTAIYNHPHQNILPPSQLTLDDPLKGSNTFVFREDIRPLKPFEGDVIMEGRYGNSIRLGSSNFKNNVGFNSWSSNIESNSQPITIIRNGQKQENKSGQEPIVEDINNDLSSIYLTANQKIDIKTPGTLFQQSYLNTRIKRSQTVIKPSGLSSFNKPQIIIKSDRIILNAQEDDIYMFSRNSIGIHTAGSINMDANVSYTINSPEIYLGLNANEPLLKGNTTGEYLKQMLSLIDEIIDILKSQYTLISGAPGEKTGPYSGNTKSFEVTVKRIKFLKDIIDGNLNGMKSESNFTR
jgi:hypothetical protein